MLAGAEPNDVLLRTEEQLENGVWTVVFCIVSHPAYSNHVTSPEKANFLVSFILIPISEAAAGGHAERPAEN